jgi:hypothetical protein
VAEVDAAGVSTAVLTRLTLVEGLTIEWHAGRKFRIRLPNEDSLPEVVRILVESGASVYSVVPQRVTLEDLFLEMMGPDAGL